ncbi:hypothetical protein [Colwellia sp. TT2012]|uniref:hypothetical protein n=1 Tax=Colwellia sp. TT2012 TaxID=1720342 RepID=UPI000B0C72FB|nr:hypothetical protein [Colwellia sp. TT2012]
MNIPVQRRFFIILDENTRTLSIISGFYHADLALLASFIAQVVCSSVNGCHENN